MKKILLSFITVLISTLLFAQSSPINPERAVVGSDENTLNPSDYSDMNAALVIWNDGTKEPYEKPYPMLRVKHKNYAVNLGIATILVLWAV